MPALSDVHPDVQRRDNNFNLIRIIAALAVLISHGLILPAGNNAADPLYRLAGVEMGRLAVDVFFVVSGFLVTASLLARHDARAYIASRALRIFPGLLAMLLLTVLVLGPLATTWPLAEYFGAHETTSYLARNAILLLNIQENLPGVFEHHPFAGVVNGPLWTLTFELKFYLLLLGLWWSTYWLAAPARRARVLARLALALAMAALIGHLLHLLVLPGERAGLELGFQFFTGAVFYLYRDRIQLSRDRLFVALALLALSTSIDGLFAIALLPCLAYVVLYAALVPGSRIRRWNRPGDYSYGIYIYGFPIQQWLIDGTPEIAPATLIIISAAIVTALAALSWHLVEAPSLTLKPTPRHDRTDPRAVGS